MNKDKSCIDPNNILELYDYKLPLVVAEYFCRFFITTIVCAIPIKYKFIFKPFISIRNNVKFVFDKPIESNSSNFKFIKLTGLEIEIPKELEFSFLDIYSNFLGSLSDSVDIEWDDSSEDQYNPFTGEGRNIPYSCGVCKIRF